MSVVALAVTLLLAWRHAGARRRWEAERAALQRRADEQAVRLRAQAVAEERARIYEDLHDDLGARLLDLVYAAPDAAHAERARTVLALLRALVADARRPPAQLLALLAELHEETRARLAAAGAELLWQQADDLGDPLLDGGRTLQLARILREAVSNALRHNALRRLRVRIERAGMLLLVDVADDGNAAVDERATSEGSGMASMRRRAEQLGGSIAWNPGTWGGTKVTLRLPLDGLA